MEVAADDRDDPRMARNGRTTKRTLVSSSRDDDNPTPCSMIQSLHQNSLAHGRRSSEGSAQVDHARACGNSLVDGCCQLVRAGTWQCSVPGGCLSEDGPHQ